MNVRGVESWVSNLKQKIRRLNFNGAGAQLNSGNQTLARTINSLSPSLKRYFDQLALDLWHWRSTGFINPASMSVEAFEYAEATARAEYAIIQQMMAQEAERAAAMARAQANAERGRAAAEAANAERRARQAAANAQRERNAAARRNAERRSREAAEARRAAKQAENEARFMEAEKERMERSRQKANQAAREARANANKAAREARAAANKTAREARSSIRSEQNRAFQEQVERVSYWRSVFTNTKTRNGLTTRQTIRRMARNHLNLNLGSLLPNTGNFSKKVRVLLHPNKGTTINKKALRQVLSAEL